jgi:Short C-terminal domain
MVMRPMMVRRRPLLRAAAIGGTYAMGRAAGRRAAQQQSYADADQGQPGASQASQAAPAPSAAEPSAQPGSGSSPDVLDQLSQLTSMHDKGALSDEEFAAAKAKVLGD